jgi:hypothetical protein
MPVITPQVYPVSTGTLATALTTAFVTPIAINILNNPLQALPGTKLPVNGKFGVKISAIYIHVHALAGAPAPTSLVVRVSPDATGDEILVPDTSATIATGFTTATKGGVVYKVDVDAFLLSENIYVTVKTNAGTATLKNVTLTLEKT